MQEKTISETLEEYALNQDITDQDKEDFITEADLGEAYFAIQDELLTYE